MRNSHLIISFREFVPFLLIFCFSQGCNKTEADLPNIIFDQPYSILINPINDRGKKDIIEFQKDGTYFRTEFTGNPPGPAKDEDHPKFLYQIDELLGTWEWRDGKLYLTDKEILKCLCSKLTYLGEQEYYDCLPTKDQIRFGSAEWFESFIAEPRIDYTLFIHRDGSTP